MSRHCPIVVCWSIHREGMFCIHAYREVFNSHAESKETGKDRAWVIRQNSNTDSRCLKKHEKQKKKKKRDSDALLVLNFLFPKLRFA